MRKRELIAQLAEKQKEIDFLRSITRNQEERIAAFEAREKLVADALGAAQDNADKLLAKAQEKADALLAEAEKAAEEIRLEARLQADTDLKAAEEKSESLVRAARLDAARYQETVEAYNKLVEESAAQAIRSSNMYAELIKARKLDAARVEMKVIEADDEPQPLPDADGDPARLMKNIYKLQNRDIPPLPEKPDPVIPGLFGSGTAGTAEEEEPAEVPTVSSVTGQLDQALDKMLETIAE